MASQVGRLVAVYDDGTVRVKSDLTQEEVFGRLVVMSGGMVCFTMIDERKVTVSAGGVVDEREGVDHIPQPAPRPIAPNQPISKPRGRSGQKVVVGVPGTEDVPSGAA